MGDIRRVTETTVRHRHLVTEADMIALLDLNVVPGSTIVSFSRESLDHLPGQPVGWRIVTQDPIVQTAPVDEPVVIPTRP